MSSTLGDKFIKAGGLPEAKEFIAGKARGVFIVEGGVIKAAPNQFSIDKPGEALGLDEWLTRMTKEASFAFKPSNGSGANPVKPGDPARPAGQRVIKDPTPQQLGEFASEVKKGTVRFEYSTP